MNILMLAPQPFLEPRGTPISVYQRLQSLSTLGHQVDLVTYHVGENVEIERVSLHRIPRLAFIKQVKVGPSWAKLPLDFLLFWKAFFLLCTRRYDVIHSHEEAAFLGVILAALFGTRHLYDMHSSLPKQLANFNFANYGPIVKLFEWFERLVLNASDAVITIGSDLEAYTRSLKPDINQVMIQNLAVQLVNGNRKTNAHITEQLRHQLGLSGRFPVVYTGTLERYQGIDLLLDSAELVCQRYPEVTFILVGGKPYQVNQWKQVSESRNLREKVKFVGTVPVDEVPYYLELAEILVSPRVEGTSIPLKLYTYLHSGKPIVATELPAHTLILNDETAVLAKPTKEALADGFLHLIQSPDLRQRIGLRARHMAEQEYGLTTYLSQLERIYRTLEPSPVSGSPAHSN